MLDRLPLHAPQPLISEQMDSMAWEQQHKWQQHMSHSPLNKKSIRTTAQFKVTRMRRDYATNGPRNKRQDWASPEHSGVADVARSLRMGYMPIRIAINGRGRHAGKPEGMPELA